jgi:hypothetical protein
MKVILPALIVAIFILSACTPATTKPSMDGPPETTSTPFPADSNPLRGNVYLDSTELLTLESFPLQFTLVFKGNLPTPCHQLHVEVGPPDADNRINVDVYSVVQTDMACVQVLEPFEQNLPLGSFPAGHYTLWVNGELIAEFDA